MLAGVKGLRTLQPARIVVAVPAAAPQAIEILQPEVEEVVYVIAPIWFEGVGKWYGNFSQTTDDEVRSLLDDANRRLVQNG
jgi:putative phosphoribosyl transferase